MDLSEKQKRRIRTFISYFLGPILFLWLSYSIYTEVRNQPDLVEKWSTIKSSFGAPVLFTFLAVFALMLVNWGIEALKWKISVKGIQKISYATAFRAILSGTSFSVTTPNRVGEYLGRVLYMNEGNRVKAVSLTIVGSISQLIITIAFGLVGLLFLRSRVVSAGLATDFWIDVIIGGTSATLLLLTVFYFRLPFLIRWLDRLPFSRKFSWMISALEEFNATLLLQLLSLSAIRFLVFILQYYLMFRVFEVDITWVQGLLGVSVSFLVMAAIPTIALFTDLGLRGEVNLQLLGLFSNNSLGISLTAASIWFINLIVPALVGSLLILSIKRVLKQDGEKLRQNDKTIIDERN